jgi:hypothetical protein
MWDYGVNQVDYLLFIMYLYKYVLNIETRLQIPVKEKINYYAYRCKKYSCNQDGI